MKCEYQAFSGTILTGEILKFQERNLFLCHLSYHKSHMDYRGVDPRPAESKASDQLHEPYNKKWQLRKQQTALGTTLLEQLSCVASYCAEL
jgi:hypothetical protein